MKKLKNPSKNIVETMVLFANFYKLDGDAHHTWATFRTAIINDRQVKQHLTNFDYYGVQYEDLMQFKKHPVYDNELIEMKSGASRMINNLLRQVKEFFIEKTGRYQEP